MDRGWGGSIRRGEKGPESRGEKLRESEGQARSDEGTKILRGEGSKVSIWESKDYLIREYWLEGKGNPGGVLLEESWGEGHSLSGEVPFV